jgi:hypothetical protein
MKQIPDSIYEDLCAFLERNPWAPIQLLTSKSSQTWWDQEKADRQATRIYNRLTGNGCFDAEPQVTRNRDEDDDRDRLRFERECTALGKSRAKWLEQNALATDITPDDYRYAKNSPKLAIDNPPKATVITTRDVRSTDD